MYTAALHNILSQRRLSRVYIHESDYREYFRYYSNLKLLPSLRDAKIKDEKQMVLYGKAIEAVTELLTKPINKENIQEAIYLVDDLFRKMVKDQDSYADMYKLFQHSHNVFNHSANVCLLTISFGLYLKLKPEALNILGLGALYHDVGLINIPKDILIKTTPLTTGEWLLIKEHPQLGVRQLQGALIFPRESLRVVAEHHEETDGSGYPKGLTRGHISLLSRICRIADKFDSMTAIKPYRAAFPPADALKEIYIKESSDDVRKLIRSFIEFLGGKKRPERS
jgi:HD-GYP domain-containing protein (c-di-GMP phosphodiesterase class II)